MHTVGGGGSFS
uniref:Uncharacterized protein n=1 Tax=Anguilla anguilla TaxID=7936 RepID=A0A0E9RA44_ANGAN